MQAHSHLLFYLFQACNSAFMYTIYKLEGMRIHEIIKTIIIITMISSGFAIQVAD